MQSKKPQKDVIAEQVANNKLKQSKPPASQKKVRDQRIVIKVSQLEKDKLTRYFNDTLCLSVSSGVRSVVFDYLAKKGLH